MRNARVTNTTASTRTIAATAKLPTGMDMSPGMRWISACALHDQPVADHAPDHEPARNGRRRRLLRIELHRPRGAAVADPGPTVLAPRLPLQAFADVQQPARNPRPNPRSP